MFFAATVQDGERELCHDCFELADTVRGIEIDETGIYRAWQCQNCKGINFWGGTYGRAHSLLGPINKKLDALLEHLGIRGGD